MASQIAAGTDISLSTSGGVTTISSTSQWKDPVVAYANLPLVGNSVGDARVTKADDTIWIWTGLTWVLSMRQANASRDGFLSASDWSTFNNKLDATLGNYITNPDAETDTAGWNLYNNSGRTNPAYAINQDITYTSAVSGNGGNGVQVQYVYNASFPSSTPNINVVYSTLVQVRWNNGPTVANNPTATQLKAAWDAVPTALAIATLAITGTPARLQYINGTSALTNGGDASPSTGLGGIPAGVTFTRSLINPIVGTASFDLAKDAVNRQGQGVSTDFVINNIDKSKSLQVSFAYDGSSGIVLGTSSDVRVFAYDINNTTLIPVTPLTTLAGPVSTIKTFVGQFVTTTSSNYRLILHIATVNAVAWDLQLDSVIVSDQLNAVAATEVPSLVLQTQPISGAVTDHMCVMWRDTASQWVPATIAGVAIPVFGTDQTQVGFATNISGLTADVFISGSMDGFSFGPFAGYEQYIDNIAGSISPLPSPFTDLYVRVGKAISATVLNIEVSTHIDEISNASGVPIKGGLLTSSAVNDGTGDLVLSPGTNGNVLVANSAQTLGLQWAGAVVNGNGFAYTVATRTLVGTLAGDVTGTLAATAIAAATVTGKAITGFVSGAGTVTAADTLLTAANKFNGNIALKANTASPVFTGDVNSSTGNVLISTLGKGLSVKTGTNSKIGQAVLVGGTVVVGNTSVTANSRIHLTVSTAGGTQGFLRYSKVVGTSFTITSTSVLETSTVDWIIVESIP